MKKSSVLKKLMTVKKENNLANEKLLADIERLKKELKKKKKYGLVWEEKPEDGVEMGRKITCLG